MSSINYSRSGQGEFLPIIPVRRISDDVTNSNRSLYIARARAKAEEFTNVFPANLLTTVVKNDFNRRLAQAKRDRAELGRNPIMGAEYDQALWPIERKTTATPIERMNAYVDLAQLMPSFEIMVRLRLERRFTNGESLARGVLEAYVDHSGDEVVDSEPVTRLKVPRIVHDEMGSYAIIETKTDGMVLSRENTYIELKQRTMGVVALDRTGFDNEFRRSLTMLANVYDDIKDDVIADERKSVVLEGIGESDAYLNVIERVYATKSLTVHE